ncbi:hypothetical protein HY745_08030 [Candidatus Desantisbacteria bacterium]|nr:hypothetical protein [Candidatus Desantisbacteria bacterium]
MKKWQVIALFFFINLISISGADNDSTLPAEEAPLNIKADNVEYVFKRGQEIGLFTGNVYLEQKDFKLNGDKLTLYSSEGRVLGEGNIKIETEDPEWKFILTGGKGEFNKDKRHAMMTSTPHLVIIQKKDNKKIEVTGIQMDLYSDKGQVVITDDVHIIYDQIEAWSKSAIFYQKEKKLIMTKNAKIVQMKNVFAAEEIIFFMDDNRIIMNNSVKGTVIPDKNIKK